ncbi:hypothetical protein AMJ44_04905 [candidate division WOR-1 bacterium DG_54_3]|uniref:DUF5723 domain-containing protein n=1 Tax=candidate division WOR-1 bacterium DG_54_3 TaxID=1703775 RepID=A0A0S7Y2N3_UNCSA|nr:MAG: hypothetical protein AMJ44_04905 [candidate division WOR-1 bacterium DG_54_3]
MKKIVLACMLLGLCISSVYAFPSGSIPYGVGAKYAAMGGAGAAIVDDISCAYFNPAGILKTGSFGLKIGAGAATEGMNELIKASSGANDPAKFFSDNFDKTVNINGGLNTMIGLNISKVGLSVIPITTLVLSKPTAGTIVGSSITASAAYEAIATLGYGLSFPGLPFASLDLGANIKSVNSIDGSSTVTSATSSTDQVTTLSGIGFDIGAKASIDTLAIPLSVALVMKDIGETLKGKTKTITTTYNPITGDITNQSETETDAPDHTSPTTLVIGASTKVPGVGLRVALDIDSVSGSGSSYSVTHLGIEYPLLVMVALRAGVISGGPGGSISMTTLGAGFDLGLGLNIAMMIDGKNSKNNSTILDFGFAF